MLLTAAQTFAVRGHHGRAAELAQRAAAALLPRLRTREEAFGSAVSQTYLSLRHLKKHDAILRFLEPLLTSLERLAPPPNDQIARILNMLAEAHATAGKLSKAEATLRRSLALAERETGPESEDVQVILTNLADLLKRQKRGAEAREVEARARRVEEAIELRARSPLASRWRRGMA
jgi:hypothetical protein